MDRSELLRTVARQLFESAQATRQACRCTHESLDSAPQTVKGFYFGLADAVVSRWSLSDRLELSA